MFQEATKIVGTTDYAFENAKGNFSSQTHKCNLFVNDIFEQSTGLDFPKWTRFFIERGNVTASSLASNNELENTTVVIIPKVGDK